MNNKMIQIENEKRISDNWGLIKRSIKVSEVVDHMIQEGFITIEEWMELKEKQITEKDRVEEFLHLIINKRNPMALPALQHSMRMANHRALADRLNIQDISDSSSTDHTNTGVEDFGARPTMTQTNQAFQQISISDSKHENKTQQPGMERNVKELVDAVRFMRENMVLKVDVEKMETSLDRLQRQGKELKNIFEGKKHEYESKEVELIETIEALKSQVNDLTEKNRKIEDELKEMTKVEEEKRTAYKHLQTQQALLKERLEKQIEKIKCISEKNRQLEEENNKLSAEKHQPLEIQENDKKMEMESKIEFLELKIAKMPKFLADLAELKKENVQLKEQNELLENDFVALREKYENLKKKPRHTQTTLLREAPHTKK